MKRWLLSALVTGLMGTHASTAVGQPFAGETTMAEWYRWSSDARLLWLGGVMGAFSVLGIRCASPPTAVQWRTQWGSATWLGPGKAPTERLGESSS